jgi:hypothetical protein
MILLFCTMCWVGEDGRNSVVVEFSFGVSAFGGRVLREIALYGGGLVT